jgi:predicted phosphoribosyltransferase
MSRRYANRQQAGRLLAQRLVAMHLAPPLVVLALPRGGVPVGAEIARALGAPLDLLLVRKIGLPWQRELALAAVVDGDEPQIVVDEEVQRISGVGRDYIDAQAQRELREIERRRHAYLGGRAPLPLAGATVIVVDDGIATGTSVRAALQALRRRAPARLVLAVPVAPSDTVQALRGEVDELVCLSQPVPFHAIGLHYEDFHQLDDAEVLASLAAALPQPAAASAGGAPPQTGATTLAAGPGAAQPSANPVATDAGSLAPPGPGDALLVVDVQRDFLPGGSLAVPAGDAVVPVINRCIERFAHNGLAVLASRDWHPAAHCSFRAQGGPWPAHCVADTPGAAFADALWLPAGSQIVSKATTAGRDAYSAFDGTDLHARLQTLGVRRLVVTGLATDYCVQATVTDALALGYQVLVLRDAVAAVDAQPGDGERALAAMQERGAQLATAAELLR